MTFWRRVLFGLAGALAASGAMVLGSVSDREKAVGALVSRIDGVFSAWTKPDSPGCVIGVGSRDQPVLVRAYGLADLEHAVANAPDTIFEAGSVSKQFTATAVLLLVQDGKLALDDAVRKFVPEVPEYGTPITIRQMLTHTSGLRDWGEIAAIGGWPRTTRAYTQAHVLDIVRRQRALNFRPGTTYSYSNTGYNLAAMLVSRVAGESFAEFTRRRIFAPLGMSHTSWRDDYRRVVPGRAIAYDREGATFRTLMPFENVHGNAGLLTTAADLLRWNANLETGAVGGLTLVHELQEPGRLADGREIAYGLGLRLESYRGMREIGHGGATAAYRAYLSRFPDQKLSIALLCNAGDTDTAALAHQVADLYLSVGGSSRLSAPPAARLGADVVPGGGNDKPTTTASGNHPPDLEAMSGRYHSDEADVDLLVQKVGDALRVTRRPDDEWVLQPLDDGTFVAPIGRIRFVADESTRVTELSVATPRVHDLRFQPVPETPAVTPLAAR
jgi:CubicO group peptidase (beta-lactamase class C family)